ncbi:hypothetical protein KCU95_g9012, partial [Aureobasidium melanogenum]
MSYTLVSFQELFASGPWNSCIGYMGRRSRRCNNRITRENLHVAEAIWDAILSGASADYVERKIGGLSVESLLDDTREALAALQAEYDGTRTKLRKAKSRTSTLELQVDVMKQGMADLEKSNTHLRSELIAAESLAASLQREVVTQQRRQAQVSGELQRSQKATKLLQDNISALESSLRDSNTSVTNSELRVADLEKRLKTSESSAKTACKQRSLLLSANTKLTSELDEAKDTIQRLERLVAAFEVDVMESNKVSMSQQQVLDHKRTARYPAEKTSQTQAQGCADEDEKKGEIEVDKQKEDERLTSGQQCELM